MPVVPKELETFGALQRKLGEAVMDTVLSVVEVPWKEVCLDSRSRPGQLSQRMKIRVTPDSGTPISVTPPSEMAGIMTEILQMRGSFAGEPWSGIKLTITSDGDCRVEFNYDPNCVDDPSFLRD